MKPLFILPCLMIMVNKAYPQDYQLNITPINQEVYVHTSYMMYGENLIGSNGMYLLTDAGIVIFDTPWDEAQTQQLIDSLKAKHQQEIVLCLISHYHEDRNGGADVLKRNGMPTWSSNLTDSLALVNGEKRAAHTFQNDTVFTVAGKRIEVYFPGEGHTIDNLVFWLPAEKMLFGGCLIKSTEARGKGNLADANLEAWPASIKKLMDAFPDVQVIVPGHQGWGGKESLQHTLDILLN